MKRPICQEERQIDMKPCKNPAKFIVDAPAYKEGTFFVCGIHARGFTSKSLHPFRLRDWRIAQSTPKEYFENGMELEAQADEPG